MNTHIRVLFLVTTPKLSEKAAEMFQKEAIPIQYKLQAIGTAPNEMIDILGLGSPDKSILISLLTKECADETLRKLKRELRLGTINSGIAVTLPLSGANNLVLKMAESIQTEETEERVNRVSDIKCSMIAAVVNQGYCDSVMEAAREAGAGGGTVVHSRRLSGEQVVSLWGLSVQEEKDIVFIVANNDDKLKIMQAIGDKCGVHSEAKGIVVSLPIESVIGLENID